MKYLKFPFVVFIKKRKNKVSKTDKKLLRIMQEQEFEFLSHEESKKFFIKQ